MQDRSEKLSVCLYCADQDPQRDRSLGITTYTDGLIHALTSRSDVTLDAIVSATSYSPAQAEIAKRRLPFRTTGGLARTVADNLHPLFYRPDADLWHYPKGHLSLAWRPRQPVVGTIHDMILSHYMEKYPQERSAAAYAYWGRVLKRSVPRFDHVITVSHSAEEQIRTFCDRHGLRCPPITVTFEGLHPGLPWGTAAEKMDAVVHLASLQPHKRTATLLEFWARLAETETELPRLKLIGTLRTEDAVRAARMTNVECYKRLPQTELRDEIASARALLLSSEIEGFGLPALEAYALGTPVAYVRGTVVEELLGANTPGGFDLDDPESFKVALEEVLRIEPDEVKARAEVLREKFSWDKCVERTITAYRTCLSGSASPPG